MSSPGFRATLNKRLEVLKRIEKSDGEIAISKLCKDLYGPRQLVDVLKHFNEMGLTIEGMVGRVLFVELTDKGRKYKVVLEEAKKYFDLAE